MEFTKMHGIGNDYIYFNCMNEEIENPEELSLKLSDRHFGVGGDGIVLILPSDKADFRMRMFNADGSEGKMCGNASRCIGKYVYEKELTDKTEVTLETLAGIKTLNLTVEDGKVTEVEVNMGMAITDPKEIPVSIDKDIVVKEKIDMCGKEYEITCVSMGNPHCIVYMDNIDDLEIEKIGPKFENHKLFPERINTEFVEVIDKNTLKMRVWERGSGETLACGTGACAVTVASVLNNYCNKDEEVTVKLLGGDLKIKYLSNGLVYMTGPAEFVFEGRI
ncbi:diaminopimelate epimerase [Clostridium sp. DSM 8431]|uniref:diaminopimelate epimerase n=1 Tax=Clostridium sp. DSM 8431 TaxID=1761781 RepID=UPI0008E5BD19|nr:diaminopimelate epimerase [Clostridium sp. DSM 8431]SFU49296.1 diaminopimelate epimerase [Clostridium sp. DSM 8431]